MITTERATQILASYGGHPEFWPQAERQALQQVMKQNPELLGLQQEALQLDEQLAQLLRHDEAQLNPADTEQLAAKILSHVHDSAVHPQTDKRSPLARVFDFFSHSPQPELTMGFALLTICVVGLWQLRSIAVEQPYPMQVQLSMAQESWIIEQMLESSTENELFALLEPELFDDELNEWQDEAMPDT